MNEKHYAFPLPAIKPAVPVSNNKNFDIGYDDDNEYGYLFYPGGDREKSPVYIHSAPRDNANSDITHKFYDFGIMITTPSWQKFCSNSGKEHTFPATDVEVFDNAIVYSKDDKTYIYKVSVDKTFVVAYRKENEDGSTIFHFTNVENLEEGDTIELI